jgi:methionyl-tRNA formyltransferase
MYNKINVALFVQSRILSDEILKKISKKKKFLNIFLVCSDIDFKKKLKKIYFSDFNWVKNNKNNKKKIIDLINKYKLKSLYAFSIQHKWIVPKEIIDKFKYFVNFHYGDIPKYRGHHPIIHAILNNEKNIFGTVHLIDEKLDKGSIIDKVKIPNNKISSLNAEKKLSSEFADYFEKLINKFVNKKKINIKKNIKVNGKFYSIKEIKKLKEVKNFSEVLTKTYAFEYPPHEPAYIKIGSNKIYLSTNNLNK